MTMFSLTEENDVLRATVAAVGILVLRNVIVYFLLTCMHILLKKHCQINKLLHAFKRAVLTSLVMSTYMDSKLVSIAALPTGHLQILHKRNHICSNSNVSYFSFRIVSIHLPKCKAVGCTIVTQFA